MQIMMNGFVNGLLLACLALGFSIVYLPTKIFHIAMAGVYTLVPYLALTLLSNGYSWWLIVPVCLILSVLVSMLCELVNHRWLELKHASPGAHLVSSLGIYIIIVQLAAIVWGNETQVLREGMDKTYDGK